MSENKWIVSSNEVSFLSPYIPDISNLKGKLLGIIDFKNKSDPKINIKISDISFNVPFTGTSIQSGQAILFNDKKFGEFNLQSNCMISDEINTTRKVDIDGKLFFNKEEIFKVNINSSQSKVPLINTPSYRIYVSPSVSITQFNNRQTLISGKIFIDEGQINLFDEDSESNVFSSDVVIISKKPKEDTSQLAKNKFLLSLYLDTNQPITVLANNFIGKASAKIDIGTRRDGFYTAAGRITIKEGLFNLGTTKLVINRGRI
jgi:hypothetical protein